MPTPFEGFLTPASGTSTAAPPVRIRVVADAAADRVTVDAALAVLAAGGLPAGPTRCAVDVSLVVAPVTGSLPETVGHLLADGGAGRIAVLSAPEALTPDGLLDALTAGADGWLTYDVPTATLVRALGAVAAGEPGLARHHVAHLIAALRRPAQPSAIRPEGSAVALTGRQWEVLAVLATESTTGAAARRLCVTEATVRWHIARLMTALQVSDRAGLAATAAALTAAEGPRPRVRTAAPGVYTVPMPHPGVVPAPPAGGVPTQRTGGTEPMVPAVVSAASFRAGWAELSAGERRTARLVAQGLTNREIAVRGATPRSTVDTQVKRAFGKLGVRSRVELATAVVTLGI